MKKIIILAFLIAGNFTVFSQQQRVSVDMLKARKAAADEEAMKNKNGSVSTSDANSEETKDNPSLHIYKRGTLPPGVPLRIPVALMNARRDSALKAK